jgi:hypothetical protein
VITQAAGSTQQAAGSAHGSAPAGAASARSAALHAGIALTRRSSPRVSVPDPGDGYTGA